MMSWSNILNQEWHFSFKKNKYTMKKCEVKSLWCDHLDFCLIDAAILVVFHLQCWSVAEAGLTYFLYSAVRLTWFQSPHHPLHISQHRRHSVLENFVLFGTACPQVISDFSWEPFAVFSFFFFCPTLPCCLQFQPLSPAKPRHLLFVCISLLEVCGQKIFLLNPFKSSIWLHYITLYVKYAGKKIKTSARLSVHKMKW